MPPQTKTDGTIRVEDAEYGDEILIPGLSRSHLTIGVEDAGYGWVKVLWYCGGDPTLDSQNVAWAPEPFVMAERGERVNLIR